jgi:hypothetical protein
VYVLLHSDVAVSSERTPNASQLKPREFDALSHALKAACTLIKNGAIVWQITNRDGFVMERSDIEIECLRRTR